RFFQTIEANWEQLCIDIETGTVWNKLNIKSEIRAQLEPTLFPDPLRANQLRTEFMKDIRGFPTRIWSVPFIFMISTGSFRIYHDIIQEKYLLWKIPIFTTLFGASEGLMGICIDDHLAFTNSAFFEFIPVRYDLEDGQNGYDDKPLRIHQVEVGKCYELLITNNYGLCRYRFGDVIKIVGYKNKLPLFEFQYRTGQMLNAIYEKTPETSFMESVTKTMEQLEGVSLVDYTATENINVDKLRECNNTKKRYILFLETSRSDKVTRLNPEQLGLFDKTLCEVFPQYGRMRNDQIIQQMEVLLVKPQTFEHLRSYMLQKNRKTTAYQFKMPRAMRNTNYLKFLLDRLL
ncbi:unnamed protein product, partial [Owenia fusiformis]